MFRDSSLLYFHAVARAGSVRQAADNLHISSSAISRMVAKAESEFKTPLFVRKADGMQLTRAGQLLADRLESIFSQIEDTKLEIGEMSGQHSGRVTLACIEGAIQEYVPAFLSQFHQCYPDVTFTVQSASPDAVISALQTRAADIGIVFSMPNHVDPDVDVLLSYEEPLYAMVSANHPLAKASMTSLEEITRHRMVMPDQSHNGRRILDSALNTKKLSAPTLLTSNSIGLTLEMVGTGAAIALMCRFTARRDILSGRVVALPLEEAELLSGTLTVCKRAERRLSPPAEMLMKYIDKTFLALHY